MTTFDNTDLSAAASAIKPQLEIERLITTGAIYNPRTSKKERYEQQVIADRASNQLESIRRSVGHSGDTGRNTTSLRERYEQQLIADKAENQLRRAAAISNYQLRASLPQTPPTKPQKSTSYSRKASDQHSVATASTAALSLYGGSSSTASNNTEYDLLDNSLFEGDGLSSEELAIAIEFGFVEYDSDNETQPALDKDETKPARDKDEEYVSFAEGQARAKARRMARAEAEEKKRMVDEKKKAKEEERLRMEAAKKHQEEEKLRLAEAEAQAKKKKEREEEKRKLQERIAEMEISKDKKGDDWQKTYKEWQMKYAR